MPAEWFERMNTIQTYDQDASALGRINAWWTAWNVANNRPFGGGFEMWQTPVFEMYAPDPNNVRDVHSIYFEVLGEHGWVGLHPVPVLAGPDLAEVRRDHPRRQEAARPAVGTGSGGDDPGQLWSAYMSAGAFLGLAYFDYVYHLVAVVVVVHFLVMAEKSSVPADAARPEPLSLFGALRRA